MCELSEILNNIKKSNCSLIGFNSKGEFIKDELMSKLKINELELDSSFSIKSSFLKFNRDKKIKSILDDTEFKTSDIFYINILDIHKKSPTSYIGNLAEKFRSESINLGIKICFYTQINTQINNQFPSIIGGDRFMYIADFAFSISDNEIKILKNRYGIDNNTFKISIEDIKNFNYICNHEDS
jgi:hypothetical protein